MSYADHVPNPAEIAAAETRLAAAERAEREMQQREQEVRASFGIVPGEPVAFDLDAEDPEWEAASTALGEVWRPVSEELLSARIALNLARYGQEQVPMVVLYAEKE